ncbi:hypothetical protein [Cellulosimicrobium marinum]|uniref:hypothetical protein n=1 Tax=Cellulosimicrobium marinum TaxID=1638992 RepID=UPI001E4132A4|nr:hypothetical protein [Cellulosimicrobium marinum]MCB7137452.1 hypothetical protein [Cellulosimicrobium marinum]
MSSELAYAPRRATQSYDLIQGGDRHAQRSTALAARRQVRARHQARNSTGRYGPRLPGQRESTITTPIDKFVIEMAAYLRTQPDGREVPVERVKFLRHGEARANETEASHAQRLGSERSLSQNFDQQKAGER